ncbi:MAG: hypothetical protein IKY18_06035, partial [Oscillospiraceae bacterium]|nr:hypothetical protein [Oscillospiraceae bacterium]
MNKKFISLLLAVCLVIGLLPVMAIAADPVTTATVTLFGTEVTIDLDPNTTDTPEALYWVNGADGGLPVEAQSTDNWNYSFTIEGDDPTVTIRGANYHDKTVAFLHNEVEGLKLAYQGKENFINTEHHRIIDSTKSMSIVAIGEASLTGYGRVVISSGTLTLNGGTITITRVDSTTNSLLDFKNSTVTVDNCTLNLNDNKTGKAYPLAQGKNLNINNSTVTMQSGTYITLAGTTNAYYNGISAALKLTVDGNSDVKIINNCTTNPDGTTFIGVGIANNDPNNVVVNGGTLEVQGTQIAMNKAPKLTDYVVNSCDMFTANGKVTEYEESTYFKVAPAGTPTTTPSTSVPATSVPATSVPATSVPATSAPATSAPATSVPATSVPATSVPATSVPATSVPATSVPATSAPTTSAPTTSAPTTSAPTTSASTSAPTSATAPAWTMTAPAVTITQPTAPATPATGGMVTLFGTAETIDLDPNTTDIPEALYWVNGEEGALPVAAQSTDNWNYSFTIEDGVPTVTIRDAKYVNANAEHLFLDNTLNGLKLAYQGKNIIDSDHRSIIKSSTSMSIDAIGEASLTATGRVVMSSTGTLTLNDGTITITRLSNQTLSLLDFKKSTVTVNNCNLNLNDNKSGKAYPLAQGKTLNITNSNVTMESGSYVTLG